MKLGIRFRTRRESRKTVRECKCRKSLFKSLSKSLTCRDRRGLHHAGSEVARRLLVLGNYWRERAQTQAWALRISSCCSSGGSRSCGSRTQGNPSFRLRALQTLLGHSTKMGDCLRHREKKHHGCGRGHDCAHEVRHAPMTMTTRMIPLLRGDPRCRCCEAVKCPDDPGGPDPCPGPGLLLVGGAATQVASWPSLLAASPLLALHATRHLGLGREGDHCCRCLCLLLLMVAVKTNGRLEMDLRNDSPWRRCCWGCLYWGPLLRGAPFPPASFRRDPPAEKGINNKWAAVRQEETREGE